MFKGLKGAGENLTKRFDEARVKMTPRERYKNDFQTRLSWMDFSVLKLDGRAYEPDKKLIPEEGASLFPGVQSYDLHGNKSILPHSSKAAVKFVGFSSSQVGGLFVSSWLNPFFDQFKDNSRVDTIEIHCVERYFLTFFKPFFLRRLRKLVPEARHKTTVVVFGGIENISADLELPKKYTGYSFLLDKNNKIRWRAAGRAKEGESDSLIACTNELLGIKSKPCS